MKWSLVYVCLLAVVVGVLACGNLLPPKKAPVTLSMAAPKRVASLLTVEAPELIPDTDTEPGLEPGTKLGRFSWTYYWVAEESAAARATRVLKDTKCQPIATVSQSFARSLRLEGSGRLQDGRTVNVIGKCRCGTCYKVVDDSARFGIGTRNRPLSPFVSVAVDPRRVKIGSTLYIPELDGMRMPGKLPWGGFVHDGCVVADDVGGGVRNRHLDFFAADRDHYDELMLQKKLTRVTVHKGGARCAELLTRR